MPLQFAVRDLLVLLGNTGEHIRYCIVQNGSLVFLCGER